MNDTIYLDHNATTPVLPEVVDAMLPYLREHFGNPSSGHRYGRAAREAVDRSRAQVASLLGCEPTEVVFTSGGTEASNLAIFGVMAGHGQGRVVTSVIEHPATARPCDRLQAGGCDVVRLGVDADGRVLVGEARGAIDRSTALVTVMHANNETGVIQPVSELSDVARSVGAVIHTDAAQSVGKIPVDINDLGVDLLTVAGHKLYAPKGVGALYVRRGTQIAPFMLGAGHEGGLRPGTENVASIVGFGTACALAQEQLDTVAAEMRRCRDALWEQLRADVEGIALNGAIDGRLPNTLSVRFPGVFGDDVLRATPEVAASTGSACHDGDMEASAVIVAMGIADQEALGTVRLTVGRDTTLNEVARASRALIAGWRRVASA